MLRKIYFLAVFFLLAATSFAAKTKTIHVIPETATIFVDGSEVGNGTYTLKFNYKTDFYVLRFEEPGYITKNVKLFKSNPNKTVAYTLVRDEALLNSSASTDGIDLANKWFDITCNGDLSDEEIWQRLMSIAITNFENVDIRDEAAGWIRTAWSVTSFPYQSIRTRLEIKLSFSANDKKTFKVKLSSEIKDSDCYGNDECYQEYPRVLKKFDQVINEIQTSVGNKL